MWGQGFREWGCGFRERVCGGGGLGSGGVGAGVKGIFFCSALVWMCGTRGGGGRVGGPDQHDMPQDQARGARTGVGSGAVAGYRGLWGRGQWGRGERGRGGAPGGV